MESYLQVAKLGKIFATLVEFALERLDRTMGPQVCPDVSALRKPLSTLRAMERLLSGMSTLVCLMHC